MINERHFKSPRVIRKLSAYVGAAAASAAVESQAGIVYTDMGEGRSFDGLRVDFNTDGVAELLLDQEYYSTASCRTVSTTYGDTWQECEDTFDFGNLYLAQAIEGRASVVATDSVLREIRLARRFLSGEVIAVDSPRADTALLADMGYFTQGCCAAEPFSFGEFGDDNRESRRGYLGVAFELNGDELHTGWIDLDRFQVYGFAYDTRAGSSILAGAVPEPPSLVLLAAGAAGLAALRRRRRAACDA